jgi:hypothetical protein
LAVEEIGHTMGPREWFDRERTADAASPRCLSVLLT